MIYGIGTDIVSVPRLEGMLERHGDRAALKILAASEVASYRTQSAPAHFLAKRFAAKEALAKAAGTGLREPVSLANIAVGHDEMGRPEFEFAPLLQEWLRLRGVKVSHLSISDESAMVVAFVILEG
ncbi:MAG TPA: holo-ACP synthase [Burkholderiales bacterium]|nr:holo-ACP synthase [Burkholderiales bacterium]